MGEVPAVSGIGIGEKVEGQVGTKGEERHIDVDGASLASGSHGTEGVEAQYPGDRGQESGGGVPGEKMT